MIKKSVLERQKKREILMKKYLLKRILLKQKLHKILIFSEKSKILEKIQKLPKNSSTTRLKSRCWKTGRSRSYFKFFGLSRHSFRTLALNALLPGIIKSSW